MRLAGPTRTKQRGLQNLVEDGGQVHHACTARLFGKGFDHATRKRQQNHAEESGPRGGQAAA
jgi:hypothetical protein